jgi:CopZ-like zinc binding protein
MSPCCSSNTFAAQPSGVALVEKGALCPSCGEKGRPVKSITLQSLLKPEALPRMDDEPYYFCASQECDVVYFGSQGVAPFLKDDLIVRVGIKETIAPRHVCYCFNHTIEEMEEEVRCSGKTTVLEDIKRRMKTACWCETKSPQGSCCLAAVTKWVQRFANSR